LLFGEPDFLATELGKRQVLDLEWRSSCLDSLVKRVHLSNCSAHCFSPSLRLRPSGCRPYAHYSCLTAVATNNAGPLAAAFTGRDTMRTRVTAAPVSSRRMCSSLNPS